MDIPTLEEILEGDYKFVLISGDYFDCPSCNPGASFSANTFYDEKELLQYIRDNTNTERMEAIWVLDNYCTGHMIKYCDITTSTGDHNVYKLEFNLPKAGEVIIQKVDGIWTVMDKEYTILYGSTNRTST